MDDGENLPQSDYGGLCADEKFIYWNAGGNILRVSKDGGKPEVVASENVGVGVDMVVDGEKVYWANHGYYSPKVRQGRVRFTWSQNRAARLQGSTRVTRAASSHRAGRRFTLRVWIQFIVLRNEDDAGGDGCSLVFRQRRERVVALVTTVSRRGRTFGTRAT
jgi:hypothetical protein